MTTENPQTLEVFAVDFAALAREIAMDIFPIDQILDVHRLSDEEWQRISMHPKFISMLREMTADWNSAGNTKERVRLKAATGLESVLEIYIRDVMDTAIPLAQRVEAGKFLARLGELDGSLVQGAGGGAGVTINISTSRDQPPLIIDATSSRLPTQALPDDALA